MNYKQSVFARFFSRVGTAINHFIASSPLGTLFTSYDSCNDLLARASKREHARSTRSYHTARRAIASVMERNILTKGVRAALRGICACALRSFGVFFMVLAAIFCAFYFLSVDSLLGDLTTWSYLLFAIIAALVGIVLLLSDRSIGYLLLKSRLCSFFLFSVLGIPDDMVRAVGKKGKNHYVISTFFAVFVAALALLFPPTSLLQVAMCLLLLLLICSVPESGFLLTITVLPFSRALVGSNLLTYLLMILSLVGYVGKLLRGNRVMRIEWQDAVVLCFCPLFLVSAFSLSEQSVWQAVLLRVVVIFFYLFAVNVLATPHWLFKCQITFVFSATVAATVGSIRYFVAAFRAGITTVSFLELAPNVNVGFESVTACAYYFVLAFAFAFPALFYTKKKGRPIALISAFLIALAASMTFVSSAWISLLLVVVGFVLLYCRGGIPAVLLMGGAGVGTYFLLPVAVKNFIFRMFFDVTSPAHLALREQGNAALKTLYHSAGGFSVLLFGTGYNGMRAVYPYLTSGAEFSYGAYHFYTYQLAEGGIFGVALFALLFFVLMQNAFCAIRYTQKRENLMLAYTGILLTAATVLFGFFHYVWYDDAILIFFFSAIALIGAGLRFDRTRHQIYTDMVTQQGAMQAELNYRSSASQKKKRGK